MKCSKNPLEVKILDGGFGTQISKRVGQRIDEDALWSARFLATNKQAVVDTHLDFLNAGSDIISTNTYQASVDGFQKHLNLTEEESYELIKEAVYLAKKACDIFCKENAGCCRPLVAGSVGPYGASLHDGSEYKGLYANKVTRETLRQWHKPRIMALIEAGVDLLALETLPCKVEAEVLLSLVKEFPNTKVWVSFHCTDGISLPSGESFQETIKSCYDLNPKQIVAIGANCTSPRFIEELFSEINTGREGNPLPLLVYPNSGESYNVNEGWHGREKCEPVYKYVHKWLNLGIRWIGGCCRMSSDEISKIKAEVTKWQENEDAKHL